MALEGHPSLGRAWLREARNGCLPFRKAIEELCDESGSSCPSCNFVPLNKPTGYIKHILSCTNHNDHVSDIEHRKLVAVCFYTCTKKGYNASPRPTRPTFEEFQNVDKIHALQKLPAHVLKALWDTCETWLVPNKLSVLLPEAFRRRDASALLNGWPLLQAVEPVALALPSARIEELTSSLAVELQGHKPEFLRAGAIVLRHLNRLLTPRQSLTYSDLQALLTLSGDISDPSSGMLTDSPAHHLGSSSSRSSSSSSSSSSPNDRTATESRPSPQASSSSSRQSRDSQPLYIPPHLPTAIPYLARFPAGIETPELKGVLSNAHLCIEIQNLYPNLDLKDLPTPFRNALGASWAAGDWAPELVLMAQLALVFDTVCEGNNDAYQRMSYKISHQAISSALGNRQQTDNTYELLWEAPMWWQVFKKGTILEVLEKGPGRALFGLMHPAGIYLPYMVEGFGESIRAFLDIQGLPTTARSKIQSDEECHYEILWDEPQ